MSFVAEFNALPLASLVRQSMAATPAAVQACLGKDSLTLADFAVLISPAAGACLETLCQKSQQLTRQRFGRVIRLFAPLYLSNECINNCVISFFLKITNCSLVQGTTVLIFILIFLSPGVNVI